MNARPIAGDDRAANDDQERDYYAEALRILEGTTMLLPQIEHLRALAERIKA